MSGKHFDKTSRRLRKEKTFYTSRWKFPESVCHWDNPGENLRTIPWLTVTNSALRTQIFRFQCHFDILFKKSQFTQNKIPHNKYCDSWGLCVILSWLSPRHIWCASWGTWCPPQWVAASHNRSPWLPVPDCGGWLVISAIGLIIPYHTSVHLPPPLSQHVNRKHS